MKHLFTLLMKTSSQLQRVCSKGLTSIILTISALLITNVPIQAQNSSIPSPESILGFKVGADFKLASYEESLDYFQKLEPLLILLNCNTPEKLQKIALGIMP